MSSNIEVFEQEILLSAAKKSRKTRRAWTCDNVSRETQAYSSQWSIFSWMGAGSLALNALSLPTVVIPFPHYRNSSHDHNQIELSSLGSFDH